MIGILLYPSCKIDTCKNRGAEILGGNAYNESSICVFAAARKLAHAVSDGAALLGRCGDDCSAGAHTEGIDSASVFTEAEIVLAFWQRGVACVLAVKAFFDI